MLIPSKKLHNGFSFPVLGLGTYTMGEEDETNDIQAIKSAIELGITHIDTAEVYTQGHCEEIIGQAIKGYDRKRLRLVSKVASHHLHYQGIIDAVKRSLERLQTDYLDLYLMHRCPELDLFEECVQAMNELVDQGLVKDIGLSNTNRVHTQALQRLSQHPFVVNQVHYNLQIREPEVDGLVEYCQKNDTFLMAWRPVNKGLLNKSGVNLTTPGIELLDELSEKYHKTPAQVAMNWLISQTNVITLVKSSNLLHLKENIGAVNWVMETGDIEKLRKEFPNQLPTSDTVRLA